ncbi:MAG: hypothetical protein VKL41_20295 [Snowella sp.]|nr:hypothetical protein [Snowella sp.]PZV25326.1 MAG: hypothetical protein DCF12_15515 [Snowella sp.]
MKFLETLPGYEKFETYPNYRYNPFFELQIIYFKYFVILRDSKIGIGSLYSIQHFHQAEPFNQAEPVIVSRLWFDDVYPLNDYLKKAKRFLLVENEIQVPQPTSHIDCNGDLINFMHLIPLHGFWKNLGSTLNYAFSEYNHDLFCKDFKEFIDRNKNCTLTDYLNEKKYHIDLHNESRSQLFEMCFYLNLLHQELNINNKILKRLESLRTKDKLAHNDSSSETLPFFI